MKRFGFIIILMFFATFVFGQIPGAVIHQFESRARDVHEDDLVTVAVMFADFLGAGGTVNVVQDNNNADYSIHGLITQLGTSITFSITLRDITTSSVLSSVQRQYTVDNIWDNSLGIPGQLSDMANSVAAGISTEHNKRQQERQAQLAREETARRQEEARLLQESHSLIGTWAAGNWSITFNENGSFSGNGGTHHDRRHVNRNNHAYLDEGNIETWQTITAQGTYTREGNTIRLSWTRGGSERTMDHRHRLELDRWGNWRRGAQIGESHRSLSSTSGNVIYTIHFDSDINGSFLRLQRRDGSDFLNVASSGTNFRKR
jgi:hypothetical protein